MSKKFKMISVILCANNPRPDYLIRVLNSLKQQTLSKNQWEVLFVDNASKKLLSQDYDLSWHPQSRHIREETLGLIHARLRGINEAKGDVLVFVDDDLVLDLNYLQVVKRIFEECSNIGAIGGKICGEFEVPVPEWLKAYFQFLAINEWGDTPKLTRDKKAKKTIPCGAGLVVRTDLAKVHALRCRNNARNRLGRKGKFLAGHEDTDMIFSVIDQGYQVGYFPDLQSIHLMPPERQKLGYIARLRRGGCWSRIILDTMNGDPLPSLPKHIRFKTFWYAVTTFSLANFHKWWIEVNEFLGKLEGTRDALRIKTKFRDPLKRRFENGQLKGFSREFFFEREVLLHPLLKKVFESGEMKDSFLLSSELSEFDERVVEYPLALAKLMKEANGRKIQLLDVGCVLNNSCIKGYVTDLTKMIWFLNPVLEQLAYENNMAYILADIRKHCLPEKLTFDFVTCLSTLEHLGMDNTSYEGSSAEFEGNLKNPEKFAIEAVPRLSGLVKPGGYFLISVPFGSFEYLYTYGKMSHPIYYTYDKQMLLALQDKLVGFDCKISIYKVIPKKGWVKTSINDNNILKHADKCAAAGAVAFIEARRIG